MDFENLCSHETHHGRGITDKFCDMEEEAVNKGKTEGLYIMNNVIKPYSNLKWVNPRVYNCLYTWYKINPQDAGKKRLPLHHIFDGMPENVLDGHTYEGRVARRNVCLLSGHYENHRRIGQEVMQNGWNRIRERFTSDNKINVKHELTLF